MATKMDVLLATNNVRFLMPIDPEVSPSDFEAHEAEFVEKMTLDVLKTILKLSTLGQKKRCWIYFLTYLKRF